MSDPTHIRLDESRFEPGSELRSCTLALAQACHRQDGEYPWVPVEVARLRQLATEPLPLYERSYSPAQLTACIDAHLSPVPALLAHHREMLERIDTTDVFFHLEARFRQYGGLMVAADPLGPDQGLIIVDRSDEVYTHIAAIHRVEAADGSTAYEVRREDLEDCTEPGEEESSMIFGTLALAMQDLLYDLRDASSFGSVTVAPAALAELLAALRIALWEHLAETGRRWVQP